MKYELKNQDRTILISDDLDLIRQLRDHYKKNEIIVNVENMFSGAWEQAMSKHIEEHIKYITKQLENELLNGNVSE